ncbi:MAG: SDR family NAD(P)-dependent oxidoreductase [Pseudomonadota bacterium]
MRPICAIVGAGEGLGTSLAARFAAEGFDLALISRSEAGSARAQASAKQARPSTIARFFPADALQPETIEAALSEAAQSLGEIEVLIYNVRGAFTRRDPLDMTYLELEETFRLEVSGAFAAAKAVLPAMRARGQGTLFFSSATAAFRGSASFPLYAIGKFGLRALTQSLTRAYAQDGIHILHVRLDCNLATPVMDGLLSPEADPLTSPEDVAQAYWLAYQQPKGAWTNELELRPYTETWTF